TAFGNAIVAMRGGVAAAESAVGDARLEGQGTAAVLPLTVWVWRGRLQPRRTESFFRLGALAICLLMLWLPTYAPGSEVPALTIGRGPSMLVEYDASFRPLRRWKGFERVVDVTSFADGSMLLVDEAASRIIMLGAHNDLQWSAAIGEHPLRARPLVTGGFL